MVACLTCTKGLFFLVLTTVCVVLFVAHSLMYVFLYLEESSHTETTKYQMSRLVMPSVVICNRIPYNQAGINNINSNLNQAYILTYLKQWLDPSFSEGLDNVPLTAAEIAQADQVIQTTFPTGNRVQRIEQLMNQCQDVINSCSFAGQSLSSFDCCQFIKPYVGTMRGICWVFDNERMMQNDIDPTQGLQIVFRVTRNSFYSNNNLSVHSGIDVYLMNNSLDAARLASELPKPVTLKDKKSTRLTVAKQFTSDLRRLNCGVYYRQAGDVDRETLKTANHILVCLIQQVQNYCGCLPVFTNFLSLDNSKYSQLMQQINSSTACSVATYDSCAKRFMFYALAENWDNPIMDTAPNQVKDAVNECRRTSHTPCQVIEFPATVETVDLGALYQTTTDYVSQLTVTYGSYMAFNVVESRNPNFHQLLSYIGWNIALWFAVGHIIWTLVTTPCDWFCRSRPRSSAKIVPTRNGGYIHASPEPVRIQQSPVPHVDTASLKPPEIDINPDVSRPPDET